MVYLCSRIVVLLCAISIAGPLCAQDMPISPHTSSTIPQSARYEIVQSHLAAKWTFRLDRSCGKVAQLVSTNNGGMTWENMYIEGWIGCGSVVKDEYIKPKFQLFSSSLAAKHTFLMNTDNGNTWILVSKTKTDGNNTYSWEYFDH